MKAKLILGVVLFIVVGALKAQNLKTKDVPRVVNSALGKRYPEATKITWEMEKGNYEANWGGKSGEDNSVQFKPDGAFVEIVRAIPVSSLPKNVGPYIKQHFNGAKIREAGKVTDAAGKNMFEVEIKGKDLIFDENGNFLKKD